MAQCILPLLQIILPLLSLVFNTASAGKVKSSPSPTPFIKISCDDTTYPSLCLRSLSPYSNTIQQSPFKMAQAAVNVSLTQAQMGHAQVSKISQTKGLKPTERKVLDVCLEQMNDKVDKLDQSVKELNLVGKTDNKGNAFRISNVQTWVSAAVSDQCSDAFKEMVVDDKLKDEVLSKANKVDKVIVNALALVNKIPLKNSS